MRMRISLEQREHLQRKFMETFKEEIKALPEEFQRILADDLVTAFENRVTVLLRIYTRRS